MNNATCSATASSRRSTGVARLLRPLGSRGSGARSLHLPGLALVAAVAMLAVALSLAPSAFAARGHAYLGETIGSPCTAALEPCGSGLLKEPSGVAVSEATHDIYVVDQGNNRVQVFDASGGFLFMFGGEVNETAAKTPGRGGEANLCPAPGHPGDQCQPGVQGSGESHFDEITGIAVDNSCALQGLTGSACTAFDPYSRDVYLYNRGSHLLEQFSPDGQFIDQTDGGEIRFGVAVDPKGTVMLLGEGRKVAFYSGNLVVKAEERESPFEGSGFTRKPNTLAVDSSEHYYLGYNPEQIGFQINQIAKVAPNPGPYPETSRYTILNPSLEPEESVAVAVDQRTDTVFVDNVTSLAVFDSAGTELERSDFSGELVEGAGVAVDASTTHAFVADAAAGRLLVLGPEPPGPPTVERHTQAAREVAAATATVEAEVNPRSEPAEGQTSYFFEYGSCSSLASCASSPFTASTPAGALSPDFETHTVTADLSGLQPHTVYHYRLHASNDHGTVDGERQDGQEVAATFTTQLDVPVPLPDSRQWELVSPPDKRGASIKALGERGVIQAAADGDGVTYLTSAPTEADPEGNPNAQVQVLSVRSGSGWISRDISGPHDITIGTPGTGPGPENLFFAPDLSTSVFQPTGPFVPSISSEASEETPYLRTNLTGSSAAAFCTALCYQPLVSGAPGSSNVPPGTIFARQGSCPQAFYCGPEFEGATADLAKMIIVSRSAALTEGGESQGLYEWSAGQLELVSVLPNGEPVPHPFYLELGSSTQVRSGQNAVSANGSRVIFRARESEEDGHLYLRDLALGQTLQLDSVDGGSGEGNRFPQFQWASSDGGVVYFSDSQRLTQDSGATLSKPDLYRCKVEVGGGGELSCELSDLTPASGSEAGDLRGAILGGAEDGGAVYFVANGALAPGAPRGNCRDISSTGENCNLYINHDGVTTYVASLSGADSSDWAGDPLHKPARVSPNGKWLAFVSQQRLTDYDNRDVDTGRPVAEVYLYNAAAETMVCPSCDPTGARPKGIEYNQLQIGRGASTWAARLPVAAAMPGWTEMNGEAGPRYQDRYLFDSGRFFFNALNGLAPQDSNGTLDVYEYEPPEVGSCSEAGSTFTPRSDGCIDLISSGTSGQESAFLDASESGDDVFFVTNAQLSRRDVDTSEDVYDARVGGGEAEPAQPVNCEGDACQQPAVPPVDSTPGSLTFNGAGNVLECPRGKVKKSGKCFAKKSRKKHHRKKGHKQQKRASSKRGGHK